MKDAKNWLTLFYPLTIVADRYNGSYSGGCYLAFPLYFYDIPKDVSGDDSDHINFWESYRGSVGVGDTLQEAKDDLISQIQAIAINEE